MHVAVAVFGGGAAAATGMFVPAAAAAVRHVLAPASQLVLASAGAGCACPPRTPVAAVPSQRSALGLSGNVSAPAVTGDGGSLITGNAVR